MKKRLYLFIVFVITINLSPSQPTNPYSPAFIKGLMDKNTTWFQKEALSNDSTNQRLITWNGATYYAGLLEAWKYIRNEDSLK